MDDLGQVLRDLNGKAMSHRVYYRNDDDGRAYEAEVFAGWMHARFRYRGHTWHLTKGSWDRREETLTGLLASIEEA